MAYRLLLVEPPKRYWFIMGDYNPPPATLLVLADMVARTIMAPIEIPVGIITALVGGPFFVWLLVRKGLHQ